MIDIAHDCPGDVVGDDAAWCGGVVVFFDELDVPDLLDAPIRSLELGARHRHADHQADLHFGRFNVAAVGAHDKFVIGLILAFRHLRSHFAITTDAHHPNDAAVLVRHLVTVCSRKMRRQHSQNQLVARLAPHGKRDQRAVVIARIAIR